MNRELLCGIAKGADRVPGERLLGRWPRKCKVCGRDFFANDDWAYKLTYDKKRKLIWFCSWHCMQEYKKKQEGKK